MQLLRNYSGVLLWPTHPDGVCARDFGNKARKDKGVKNGVILVYVCFVNATLMGVFCRLHDVCLIMFLITEAVILVQAISRLLM